ncbi:MAG: hypothetical protein CVU43_01010 [Chloroflexi bacterium HGW-Chloroflexi-5]|jgi:hypothetical protein|nr:MAG: hypothetical protein CVU43_01010 [Chloroflexi bacterium HGW-Chloroflexi-5]
MNNGTAIKRAWFMLPVRLFLFAGIQALFALGFWVIGNNEAWNTSANWWPIFVGLANLVCLLLLVRFYKAEGDSFWSIFKFHKEFVGKDLLAILGFLVISGPVAFIPNMLLGNLFFGDINDAVDLFIRPLPMWAVIASILFFPVTQGLVEIPTYMMFVMPRLEKGGLPRWASILLPTLFLAAQHIAIPLLFNMNFILWRFLMFLPFALLVALVIKWRPRLLPYIAIIHVLMDVSTAVMLLPLAY